MLYGQTHGRTKLYDAPVVPGDSLASRLPTIHPLPILGELSFPPYRRLCLRKTQLGLTLKTVCALIKTLPETGPVEDKSGNGRPEKTTIRLVLVHTSLVDHHLTPPYTGTFAAVQPRNPSAFRRLLIVLGDP